MVTLKDILRGLEYCSEKNVDNVSVNGITSDSKMVRKGSAFVAVRGHSLDGHNFIKDAVKRGARVVISEKDFPSYGKIVKIIMPNTGLALPYIAANFYGRPSSGMTMIGITGTNGKTTITYLLENILRAAGREPGVIGTINYRFKGKIFNAKNTTPGPIELQSLLSKMADSGVDSVAMEVSSHSLDQGRVNGLIFDYAIFTNVTRDHLDYHKTLQRYLKAKAKLLPMVKKNGVVILNIDDPKVRRLKRIAPSRVITYGITKDADITAKGLGISQDGSKFTIVTPGYSFDVKSPLIGIHNVSNILAAAAVGFSENISRRNIKRGIESFSTVPGRLELVDAGQPFKVFVDFAHTEDALINVLSSIRKIAKRNIVTVFGCGGNRDKTKRPLMGRAACRLSDKVFITSDNPRFERAEDIINDIEEGIRGKFSNYTVVPDRRLAIERAVSIARKDDIVLIAGKGHEAYQIIKDKILAFDDREVAGAILKKHSIRRAR